MQQRFKRQSGRFALLAVLAISTLTLHAWNVSAGVSGASALQDADPNTLRDKIDPCFNNSPVGRPFTQPMPIPPTASPVPNPDAAEDTYVLREQRGEAQIVPGRVTPIWGYEGITPGPTILARKGRQVNVTFVNNLPPAEDPSGIIDENPQDPVDHPF